MGGNRRHLPVQDTPSATPFTKAMAEAQRHFLSTASALKHRFQRDYRPTPQERLVLARDFEGAARELFDATARATLRGRPVQSCATVLHHVAEQVTAQAVNTWNELSHTYRLVWMIQEPAKQRGRFKAALPSERELPPIDAIDIEARLQKALTRLADKLEREVCEKALLSTQVPSSDQGERFATKDERDERKEGAAQTPLAGGRSQAADPGQSKEADAVAEYSTGEAADGLGENEKLPNAPEQATLKDETHTTNKGRQGDERLLGAKRVVNFKTAEDYLGMTDRHRLNLMNSGKLIVEGQGRQRNITTASLRAYLSPE